MESSKIADVNDNDTWQELELMKNKVLAKSSFTRSVNKLTFDMEELDVSEIQEAYKKMESCFEATLEVMKSLSEFYIRKQDVEKWKGVDMQMRKVKEDFIMADHRTRKYLTLRKSSASSGMNPMKMTNDHDTHGTECMVTEDTILQRHAGVENTKVNRKIHKSVPVPTIYMQPQPSNDSQVVSSIIPMMDKTQVNSDCEFYDIYTYFLNKVRALRCYGAVSKSTNFPSPSN